MRLCDMLVSYGRQRCFFRVFGSLLARIGIDTSTISMRALLQRTRRAQTVAQRCRLAVNQHKAEPCDSTANAEQRCAAHCAAQQHCAEPAPMPRRRREAAVVSQEKGSVVKTCKTTATRNSETLPALNDLVGLAGFGLITVQWLMDDVLVLRVFGLASCASMVIFNLCRKPR